MTARGVAPADYAKALERLHAGMRKLDVASPHFTLRVRTLSNSWRAATKLRRSPTRTVSYIDVDGDKAPDFAINVVSDHPLTASDFVL